MPLKFPAVTTRVGRGVRIVRAGAFAAALTGAGCVTPVTPVTQPPLAAGLPPVDGDAEARLGVDEQQMRFTLANGEPAVEIHHHRTVQILRDNGQGWRSYVVPYDTAFSSVLAASLMVAKPDGSTRTWTKSDAADSPAFPGFVLYADSRALAFQPPPAPLGSWVTADSAVVRRRAELFQEGWAFGDAVPTALSRFVVEFPRGWGVQIVREQAGAHRVPQEGTDYRVETTADVVRWIFERKDLAASKEEDGGPGVAFALERIFLRLARWTDAAGAAHAGPADPAALSAWVAEQSQPPATETPALKATVTRLLADVPADNERLKAATLYAWVRDRVRYCAVEIGMGGWIPHDAASTLERSYGDCKDKANLLKVMLAVAGIDADTVQINAGPWPSPFRLPALSGNFNHAILLVKLRDGPVFADPTSRTCPFGDLPAVDEDRVALPNQAAGHALVNTPPSSAEANVIDERARVSLAADGKAVGTFEVTMRGEAADDARFALLALPSARHAAFIEDAIAFKRPEVKALVLAGSLPPALPADFSAKGEIAIPMARSGLTNGLLLRPRSLMGYALALPEDAPADRRTPYLLGERRTRRTAVELDLPVSLRAGHLPNDVVLEARVARVGLRWRASNDGRALTVEREIVVKERIAELADYAELHALLAAARRAEETPVALVPRESP